MWCGVVCYAAFYVCVCVITYLEITITAVFSTLHFTLLRSYRRRLTLSSHILVFVSCSIAHRPPFPSLYSVFSPPSSSYFPFSSPSSNSNLLCTHLILPTLPSTALFPLIPLLLHLFFLLLSFPSTLLFLLFHLFFPFH